MDGDHGRVPEVEIYVLRGGNCILLALRFHCLIVAPACQRISYSGHHCRLWQTRPRNAFDPAASSRSQGDVDAMLSSAFHRALHGTVFADLTD